MRKNKQYKQFPKFNLVYMDYPSKIEYKPIVPNYIYDEDEIYPDVTYGYKVSDNPNQINRHLLNFIHCKVKNKQLIKELLINFKPYKRYDLNVESVEFFYDTRLYNIIAEIDIEHVCNEDVILSVIRTILPGLTGMEIFDDGCTFIRYNFYKDDELVLEYQLELEDEVYYKHFK